MNYISRLFVLLLSVAFLSGCRQSVATEKVSDTTNTVVYAKGLSISNFPDFSIVTVSNPWPAADRQYRYVLSRKNVVLPDSLKDDMHITVPVSRLVVTSTTHIPSLEMLDASEALVGFPETRLISSPKIRQRIDSGKVRELGTNAQLNIEQVLDLNPEVIIGYGLDNNNPILENLSRSGLKVMLNGDWNEQSALGKAEWIKLFGALLDKQEKADSIFNQLVSDYQKTAALAKTARTRPSVMTGSLFEGKWYVPSGNSWGAKFITEAGGEYLWSDDAGTGGLSLSFEAVADRASEADFWIGPGNYGSLSEMTDDVPGYSVFESYRKKNVFSYSLKKGATGGLLYFELAPNRPDLVLKDLVSILHPELLPQHQPVFFERLK